MRKRLVLICRSALALTLGGQLLKAQPTTLPAATAASGMQGDSASVVGVIQRFHAAMAAGDSATVMSLLASDAVILESGGVETRTQYQSHHLPGDINFAKSITSTRGPVGVLVRGDVAWAWSTSTTTGESRGRPVNSMGAELMVLTRTPSGWRISAIHWSSRARRPPAAPPS